MGCMLAMNPMNGDFPNWPMNSEQLEKDNLYLNERSHNKANQFIQYAVPRWLMGDGHGKKLKINGMNSIYFVFGVCLLVFWFSLF